MSFARQVGVITLVNIRSLPGRIGISLVTVVGVATTVAVMITLLAVGAGLEKISVKNLPANQVVVLPAGAASESVGGLPRAAVAIVSDAPGVLRTPAGQAVVDPSATVVVEVLKKLDGAPANVPFRGVGPMVAQVRPGFRIVAGRLYQPGLHEVVVGAGARARYRNLDIGDSIELRGTVWRVVGVYEDGGGLGENAITADIDTLLAAFGRDSYQSVIVRLKDRSAFEPFKDALTVNPQVAVDVKWQRDYVRNQTQAITRVFDFMGWFVGSVMGLGAVFGAVATMYTLIDGRTREIATLRAIGYGGGPVVLSVLFESLLLAIPGAVLGYLASWLTFNGRAVSTAGLSFPLAVTPELLVSAVVLSLLIGLIGGIAPAVRAARTPVVEGLRAT